MTLPQQEDPIQRGGPATRTKTEKSDAVMSETEDKLGFRLFEENGQWWAMYQSAPNLPVAASQREVSLWRELTEQRGVTLKEAAAKLQSDLGDGNSLAQEYRLIEAALEAYASSRLAAADKKLQAEKNFLDASVAVWREIDRLMKIGPYPGIPMAADLRLSEKLAWERYRAFLDGEK